MAFSGLKRVEKMKDSALENELYFSICCFIDGSIGLESQVYLTSSPGCCSRQIQTLMASGLG